ncbi:MAG TPA: hypothetical protein VIV63_03910, partial [Steroidobacteraceae bacterium]
RRREQRLAELPFVEAQRLRAEHLDSYPIWQAQLPRMTDERLAALASYGIETAEDVLRMPETLSNVVHREWVDTLRAWAAALDAGYQVDAEVLRKAIASNEEDTKLQKEQSSLLRKLRSGPYQLHEARAEVTRRRNAAEQRFIEARRSLLRARSEPVT